jgi:hypothetical protein
MRLKEHGFTLVELMVSSSLTLCVAAAIFAAIGSTGNSFSVQSESADMQQRLRVAALALSKDLAMAGAGTDGGPAPAPLIESFAPVLPYHLGRSGGDAAGTFRNDAVTVIYVPSRLAQATVHHALPAQSTGIHIDIVPGCPLTDAVCGFSAAPVAMIFDDSGSFDRFTVAGVEGALLQLQHSLPDSSKVYAPGSRIVGVVSRSYFLRPDRAAAQQLVRDDGDGGPVVPVADHVVQLGFEYFGETRPPARPLPPEAADRPTSYPAGENCVFARDPALNVVARLPVLAATESDGLVELSGAQLSDGPWCPDAGSPNRFDADLLRVRRIAVTVRVEPATAALRGASDPLFAHRGSASAGGTFLPDQTIRFQISPRNMAIGR